MWRGFLLRLFCRLAFGFLFLRRLGRRFLFLATFLDDGHLQQIVTLGELVALLHQDLFDLAGIRRRHFHRRLVGLHRHQWIIRVNGVAFGDVDLDDRHIIKAVQIRDLDGLLAAAAGFLLRRRLALFRFRLGFLFSLRFFRLLIGSFLGATGVTADFHHAHDIAFADLVTHLDGDPGDLAFEGRRQFDRRLVGFHGQNRIFFLNRIPRTGDDFDDLDFISTAEIGNLDFLFTHGGLLSSAPGSFCCDRFRTCAWLREPAPA